MSRRASLSRRQFLSGQVRPEAIRPPGTSTMLLSSACTGCGLCVERCPTGIINMADGLPRLDFHDGECTFCSECAHVCPEPVFALPSARTIPYVATIGSECLASRDVACQSCRDGCPEDAIRFRPRIGGPFLPFVSSDRCSGCGACVASCPVDAVEMESRLPEVFHA
ncbi:MULTISPECIES: ferredoxin-type protein NapF [unclassified Rhizobium]|uniref:ferredoxin-type protein NapF n=1 Tax=unclassified Rhizobium TaxID=2613769 RepID=UPI001AD9556A|nr:MULTISPECIES: ferredoxin-type protein NapF [unclassified Rhizobium]MBO9126987.1 ferredoxin-type protein NapF [Rhizobium sp. 16-488-2b]MBO9177434.1 ferredoxin-type protein NapF [Rhizobium sp. 16-488-2a]